MQAFESISNSKSENSVTSSSSSKNNSNYQGKSNIYISNFKASSDYSEKDIVHSSHSNNSSNGSKKHGQDEHLNSCSVDSTHSNFSNLTLPSTSS